MARYHIKKDGTPGLCHARPGFCPLGGEGEHYPSMEAAQAYADSKNLNSFMSKPVKSVADRPASLKAGESDRQRVNMTDRDIDNLSREDMEVLLANGYEASTNGFDAEEAVAEDIEYSDNGMDEKKLTSMLQDDGTLRPNQEFVNTDYQDAEEYASANGFRKVGEPSELYEKTNFPTNLPEGRKAETYAVVDKSTGTVYPVNMGQLSHVDYISRGDNENERLSSLKKILHEEQVDLQASVGRPASKMPGEYYKELRELSDSDIDNLSARDAERLYADGAEESARNYAINAEEGLEDSKSPAELTSMLQKENVFSEDQELVRMNRHWDEDGASYSAADYAQKNGLKLGASRDMYSGNHTFPASSPEGVDSDTYVVVNKKAGTATPINMGQITHIAYLNGGNTPKERLDHARQVIREDRDIELEND